MLDTAPVVATTPDFEAVFRDAFEPMVRALTVASGSRTVAEDCVQEAFSRAFVRWRRIGVAAQRQDGVMLQQQQRVGDLAGRARGAPLVLAVPCCLVADPTQPLGAHLHRPRTIAGRSCAAP